MQPPRGDLTLRQADYELGDDLKALRDAFAAFFDKECPPERVRDAEPDGYDDRLWRQLGDLRSVPMGVPEEAGGDGAKLLELVLVTEELGRHLAPVPLVEALAAARLLARIGSGASSDWLARTLAGDRLVTVALHRAGEGVRQLVPAGAVADAVVGLLGDDLVLCTTTGTQVAPANQGRTPLGWWDLSGAATERTVLGSGPAAVDVYETAQREWRILIAASLVGMADAALRIAVEHAKDRIAFGVPIGSFQAVAHPLADVAIGVETVRRLVWKAAWWADADPTAMRHLIPMAYLAACETAVHSATVGVHTLGGVGFTVESDEQLYFRRATGWTLIAGDPLDELDRIADALYGAAGIPGAHGAERRER
jgi:alkylation response protein AidB-like acyl-CoA dehydrogenase